jgi:hypothetical protein
MQSEDLCKEITLYEPFPLEHTLNQIALIIYHILHRSFLEFHFHDEHTSASSCTTTILSLHTAL